MIEALREAMGQIGVSDEFWGFVAETFRYTELAEAVIEERIHQCDDPSKIELIWGSFRFLRPSSWLRGKSDELYLHHCNEIIDRVIHDEDVNLGTDAEVLGLISDASQEAKPTRTTLVMAKLLFDKIFPQYGFFDDVYPTDFEVKEAEAEIARLKKKLATERVSDK